MLKIVLHCITFNLKLKQVTHLPLLARLSMQVLIY